MSDKVRVDICWTPLGKNSEETDISMLGFVTGDRERPSPSLHSTTGAGLPNAAQKRTKSSPSMTTASLVDDAVISTGSDNKMGKKWEHNRTCHTAHTSHSIQITWHTAHTKF